MGHLGKALAEASVDPSSITLIAFTHSHQDHVCGLLRRDGREAFTNLGKILIAEDAVAGFLDWPQLARFRSLLAPIRSGDRITDHLRAVAIPGHAPGHVGFVLSTGEDNIVCCGDLIHVPAAQFARPELTWIYDDNQALARATRIKVLADAAHAHTWLVGAHLGRPGIGKVVREGQGYTFMPVA